MLTTCLRLFVAACVGAFTIPAHAWGPGGHRTVVGAIADGPSQGVRVLTFAQHKGGISSFTNACHLRSVGLFANRDHSLQSKNSGRLVAVFQHAKTKGAGHIVSYKYRKIDLPSFS